MELVCCCGKKYQGPKTLLMNSAFPILILSAPFSRLPGLYECNLWEWYELPRASHLHCQFPHQQVKRSSSDKSTQYCQRRVQNTRKLAAYYQNVIKVNYFTTAMLYACCMLYVCQAAAYVYVFPGWAPAVELYIVWKCNDSLWIHMLGQTWIL